MSSLEPLAPPQVESPLGVPAPAPLPPPAPDAAVPLPAPAPAPLPAPLAASHAASHDAPFAAPLPEPSVLLPPAPSLPTLPPADPAPSTAARWGVTPSKRGGSGSTWIQRWFSWRVVWMVIGLAFTGGLGLWEKFGPSNADDTVIPVAMPSAPDEWPADIEPIAAFVERERGLAFEHPVAVEFLSEADYVGLFSVGEFVADAEVAEEYGRLSDLYGAAGLAVEVDLLAAESTVRAVGTIGVYFPDEDAIFIRGTEMTPAVEAVLAHELTHALQAQHFDLALGGPDDLALRSIIEADALRVERIFMATLTSTERESATEDNSLDEDTAEVLATVPAALVEATSAPYVLGPLLVDAAFATNGNAGVDQLLRVPPTEQLLLNPWMLGQQLEDAAPLVAVPPGAEIIEEVQQLSMLDMLAMLDTWLPWTEARGALDGWNGGGYVSYVNTEGTTCFSVNASFNSDPQVFASAVANWAAASGSDAVPTIQSGWVGFEACDRGPDAAAPPLQTVSLTTAAYVESAAMLDAAPEERLAYQCLARAMIDHELVAPLLSKPSLTPDEEAIITSIRGVEGGRCGLTFDDS